MRYFVRPLALAVISFVAIGAWMVQSEANGSADIRPLSAAEQRATWGTEACELVYVVSDWKCLGAFSAPCSHTWIGTCTATCRDGCTGILDLVETKAGNQSFGFAVTRDCGVVPGLGMTYNVLNCTSLPPCCTGTIVGTFFCAGVTETIWNLCGPE